MKNKKTIKIEARKRVNDVLMEEFKTSLSSEYFVIIKKEEEDFRYAAGIVNDIIIYFDEHLLISSFLLSASYDIVKAGLINLYKKLKNSSSDTSQTKKISLRHKVNDKIVEFELETNFSEEVAENMIVKCFEQANREDLTLITSNKKYLSKESNFNNSKFIYDDQKGLWIPLDYEKMRNDLKRKQDDFIKRFKS